MKKKIILLGSIIAITVSAILTTTGMTGNPSHYSAENAVTLAVSSVYR